VLPFTATDVVFDARRGMLYATSIAEKRVYFVDLASGMITRQFNFASMPESLALTPDGSRLFVGLTLGHIYYSPNDDYTGYVASFDLDLQVKDRQYPIAEDPFDLVATSNGRLVVSSGSGQWTYARVFDAATGALISSVSGIRHLSHLALHPSETIVYAADTDVSPSDIERYDLSATGVITARWDSTYHGDHRMGGNVWASPIGDALVTRGGDVFTAAGADRASDMIYRSSLTPSYIDALAFDAMRNLILTGRDGDLRYYNLRSFESIGSIPVAGKIGFLGVRDLRVFALLLDMGQARLVEIAHPVPHGDTDTAPVAAVGVIPETGHTTLTDITLDASASTDAEGPLLSRWDLNDDGVWETEYSANPVLVRRFSTAGSKFIRLRVKDSAGNVDDLAFRLDVAFQPDPGAPGEAHPSFRLPFAAAHAVFDPLRPYAYVTSKQRRALYFVNLETGFIERTFSFEEMPERMALTPDGSQLYVTLLTREHSSYYWEEDQVGFIARFDLARKLKDRQFEIPLDPFDLAPTGDGRLVVTSGSGQWTDIAVFDGDTGAHRGRAGTIRELSTVSLHPSGGMVYTAGGTSYPQDVHRWSLTAPAGIAYAWDSTYHGHHRVGDDLWVSPRGDVLITAGADVYGANGSTRATDLLYQRSLAPTTFRDLVWSPALEQFAAIEDGRVRVYDMTSYAQLASFGLPGIGRFIGRRGPLLYAMQVEPTESRLDVLVHGNRPPSAAAAAASQVECEGPSGAAVELDASASSDPDSVPEVFQDIVSYDWFEVDPVTGQWAAIGAGQHLAARLGVGSHDVRVRVTDHAGASSTAAVAVTIVDSTPPEISIAARPPWLLPPMGRMVRVGIEVATDDACGDVAVSLVSVQSNAAPNRPIEHHQRGGPPPDIQEAEVGSDDRELLLRAEPNPGGRQRVYTLVYSATDESGNQTLAQLEIRVWLPRSPRDWAWLFWLRILRAYWW
jgi:DNA-binding beta-propeller fold protein YncE